jgi:C4-dicarboxylate transporter, DcuC family
MKLFFYSPLPLALLFIVPALVKLPPEFSNNSVSIAAAMLISVTVAGLTTPKESPRLAAVFFEGAGYAYTNIISIFIVAMIFTEGVKVNGLIEILTNALANRPVAVKVASLILPFTLSAATGSGSAPALAVMNILVPVATKMNLDPVSIGGLTAVAAQLGRTMSPVAAVVIMSATISEQSPLSLVKYTALPLLAGFFVVLVATLFNWV